MLPVFSGQNLTIEFYKSTFSKKFDAFVGKLSPQSWIGSDNPKIAFSFMHIDCIYHQEQKIIASDVKIISNNKAC